MSIKKILYILLKTKITVVILLLAFITSSYYTHPSFIKDSFISLLGFNSSKNHFVTKKHDTCFESYEISPQLNHRYRDYIWNSAYQKFGDVLSTKDEIRKQYLNNKLVYIDSSDYYVVDTLYHSFSFLIPEANNLLLEIGKKFKYKLINTDLKDSRIMLTSLLRTERSVKKLRKWNRNAVKVSSHMHGTTFDIAYNEFVNLKKQLSQAEVLYLKETLAQTLKELVDQDKCFVTYETRQPCFHVVNKNVNLPNKAS